MTEYKPMPKQCKCGVVMEEVIGYDDREHPVRAGWYCLEWRDFDKAILRETKIEVKA